MKELALKPTYWARYVPILETTRKSEQISLFEEDKKC